jgi:hypothetical protein
MLAADFLEANFDKVFGQYQKLLHSDNYVTRRQSLKLLGELLLDRHNFSVSQKIEKKVRKKRGSNDSIAEYCIIAEVRKKSSKNNYSNVSGGGNCEAIFSDGAGVSL